MAAIWPSIIPLGPSMCAPARACATAIAWYRDRVASLSTRPLIVDDAAVPMVGELVEAGVGHEDGVVAEVGAQRGQRTVQDSVGAVGTGSQRVLVLGTRYAEQHQPTDAGSDRLLGGGAQRIERVLHDAGHRGDRLGLVQTVRDEHRQHQMARREVGLGHQAAHGRSRAEAARTNRRAGHAFSSHAVESKVAQ